MIASCELTKFTALSQVTKHFLRRISGIHPFLTRVLPFCEDANGLAHLSSSPRLKSYRRRRLGKGKPCLDSKAANMETDKEIKRSLLAALSSQPVQEGNHSQGARWAQLMGNYYQEWGGGFWLTVFFVNDMPG